ncbi:cell division cycle and apoptosis regulator protein 1-like isoform X2 [Lucilia sericata]|uniref:cell division cycle and apoptosis regulator protein 1-like isoform X2 n=1 Tax=Lucilia sericata TaxID=13632 RepID=UPI0018A7F40D|nr:cell division cycle and apoptosis regulator protein 1-like isoform X2 [Lucilia sericata]
MSYGNQSNAPWQRNVMQGHPQSGGFHQGTQMFMQNAQQSNMAAFGHGGMQAAGSGNMFPGGGAGGGGNTVSYPQPRSGLNPVAFQQGGGGQSHYNSIGTVTKVSNDCGLVNDEVFFYRNVCKGPEPKLGDRVIFEATYSNNGQFKWNATRIQLMQQPQPLMGSNKSNYSTVAPPNEYQRGQMRRNSPKRSPVRGRHERDHRERDRLHRSRDRDEAEHDRKRRREDNERSRDRGTAANNRGAAAAAESRGNHGARNEKERDRGESRKKERDAADREREERERERERERARDLELHRAGAKGRRAVAIKRYKVQIPKFLLTIKTADVQDLRQRYTNLYIPSDYFHANVKWSETFTPDNPFSLRRPCQFHIMHEIVEPPTQPNPDLLEPADANYLYSAKVMLMSLPPIAEIYKKCFEYDDNDADHHTVHPSRLINFLVGVKSRAGPMAIGGPWSPSLDGENPDTDPSVLIRTAIRTCKALTGIDLSNCTQWYRFVELYYHRTEYKNMEKDGPPRVETVVIYLPDVHSCMPSIEEWQTLTQVYKTAADDVIARRAALVAAAAAANVTEDNDKTNDVEMADDSALADDSAMEGGDEENPDKDESTAQNNDEEDVQEEHADEEDPEEKMDDSTASADVSGAPAADEDVVIEDADAGDNVDETAAAEENDEPAPEPTHYSLLDLKSMKVQEIRDELLARNLPDKGVRNVVMARLAKALNTEKAEEHKNKRKNKPEQSSPQKTVAAKKSNDSNTKAKKDEEKMEVDSENNSKAGDKKQTEANKKKPEKKGSEVKVNDEKAKGKATTDKKNSAKAKDGKEEPEDWADIIDFELSDIVILDEYDSSKNPEENNLKEMSEKEKAQLIRRYTLPSAPHVVVHPNRQAKGGKFDCAVMSLSVLLDYHPDDTKERFFEVSLFAELFNDMLMRDFAFNIYKEIYLYEETPATNNSCEITEIKGEGDVKKEKSEAGEEIKKESNSEKEIKKESKEKEEEKEKTSKKDNKTNSEEKSSKEHHNDDSQSIKSESRKRKISTSTSIANGKDRELSVSDKKMVVVKPLLLLSFVYFDTTHCGYIFEKDLEELFTVMGLNLSRSQIKKVLGKLATRQAIYYRKLTDKEETQEAPPAIEDVDDLPMEELQLIAAGNNQYENIFGRKDNCKQTTAIDGDDNKDGLINFNGTVVHVGKLLTQINRTEKNYSDLEKLYNDLLKQHTDLQKEHNKSTTKIKDLQSEVKSVSRKLTDANQDFYSLNRKYRDQNSTLSYIYTRVAPYFAREKDKDKDAKTEGTRDKDKDEKDKSKDSEKTKETPKDDKEKEKDDKEKEKPKDDKEKDDKEKEKVKDDKEKEKELKKDDKEKEKESKKDDKEKDSKKDDKEKEKETKKDDKEKEKPKEDKEKEKPKDDKVEKPTIKTDKVKSTPQKNITDKSTKAKETTTPVAKKQTDTKSVGKVAKKSDTVSAKK